jgi:hypothetical protein
MSIIYSISLVYQKNNGASTDYKLRTGIYYDVANSKEALGEAIAGNVDEMKGCSLLLHSIVEIDTKEYETANGTD